MGDFVFDIYFLVFMKLIILFLMCDLFFIIIRFFYRLCFAVNRVIFYFWEVWVYGVVVLGRLDEELWEVVY